MPSSSREGEAPAEPRLGSARLARTLALGDPTLTALGMILVAGLYALTLAIGNRQPLVYDEAIYLQIARDVPRTGCPILATGGGALFADNPPLVMYVAAAVRAVLGDDLHVLRAAQVTLWALPGYVAVFLLAARLFGLPAGVLAVASFYAEDRYMREAAEVRLDVPLATLTILTLWALSGVRGAASRRGARLAVAASAACVGLACVTKHQGVLLPAVAVTYLLALRIGSRHAPASAGPRYAEVWVGGGALVGAMAWVALNDACGGNLLATIVANLQRVGHQTAEPWFHRPVLEYWRDLHVAVGSAFVGGCLATALLWGSRLRQQPAVALVIGWVVVLFVFCSAIGLRHERYFLPAVPAMAVLVGALAARDTYAVGILAGRPGVVSLVRAAAVVLVLVPTVVVCGRNVGALDQLARLGQRSDRFYEAVAEQVRAAVPPDERVLLSRPQTAYLAERNYFLSEFEPDADALVAMLANPDNRITLVVYDSGEMFHPDMAKEEQRKVVDYVGRNFERLPVPPTLRAAVFRRTQW